MSLLIALAHLSMNETLALHTACSQPQNIHEALLSELVLDMLLSPITVKNTTNQPTKQEEESSN